MVPLFRRHAALLLPLVGVIISNIARTNAILPRVTDVDDPQADDLLMDDMNMDIAAESVVPKRFLVTLDPDHARTTEDFQSHLNALNVSHRVVLDLTSLVPDVFYGVSVELEREDDAQLLEQSAQVVRINQVRIVTPIDTFDRQVVDGPVASAPSKFPPHIQTNITELHSMGIFGQGIKVALIDSGVDCKHPALGGGFGKGFKIGFGRDIVKDPNAKNHSSPCTPCSTHGTHVAGIVGASDEGYGFTGVAPNATLGMYRVFGCGEHVDSTNDLILAALLHAHKDGADVISASLGGPGGWGQGEVLLNTVNKLVEKKGVIILFAAGNEGAEGLFYGDSPASAASSISVGSVDSTGLIAGNFTSSTGKELTYYATSNFQEGHSYPVYVTSNSTLDHEDACAALPKQTPNLTDYIVLIQRGTCLFTEKVEHAKAKGTKRILFYMNSTAVVTLPSTIKNISVAVISEEDGRYISEQTHKDPTNFRVSFPKTKHFYLPSPEGGFMSNFSQYGPTFDMTSPQPAVSGVGGSVVSTYPLAEGGYASLSGTSMATPQLAGIVALILSARGKNFTGEMMRPRLATTTRILEATAHDNRIQTVVHQGGGLVNAFCAVFANTTLSTASLALNDSISFKGDQEFTISNHGNVTINYNIEHVVASAISTFSENTKYDRPDEKLNLTSDKSATAEISPQTFTLAPGSDQVITIHFTPPQDDTPNLLSVYSGFIVLNTDIRCEKHNLPYFGVSGSLKAQKIIDKGPDKNKTVTYPYISFKKNVTKSKDNGTKSDRGHTNGTFVWDLAQHKETVLRYRTLFGSPLVRIDIMHANATPTDDESNSSDWKHSFKGVPLIGLLPGSDSPYLPRSGAQNLWSETWNGTVATTESKKLSLLPTGSYKLLLRALRVTGNKTQDKDYDYWISPEIRLAHKK